MKRASLSFKMIALMLAVTLGVSVALIDMLRARERVPVDLPSPVEPVFPSAESQIPLLKGLRCDPADPLSLEFIVDPGDRSDVTSREASRLVHYFLASLTTPQSQLWVNLSPDEEDRVLAEGMETTELGRDLLAQDYLLKQLACSLTHPDTPTGEAYWRVENGKSTIENRLGKIWIVPDKAEVYENGTTVVITEASLKLQCEDESQQVLLPVITKDVNEGKNFARLRQIYHSLILAKWFKTKLRDSLYAAYIDAHKLKGIDTSDPALKEKIFALYVESFKKGVYDVIRSDSASDQFSILDSQFSKNRRRRFFSGGFAVPGQWEVAVTDTYPQELFSSSSLKWLRVTLAAISSHAVGLADSLVVKLPLRRKLFYVLGAALVVSLSSLAPQLMGGYPGRTNLSGGGGFALSEVFQPRDNASIVSDGRDRLPVSLFYVPAGLPLYIDEIAPALDSVLDQARTGGKSVTVVPCEPVDMVSESVRNMCAMFWKASNDSFTNGNALELFTEAYTQAKTRRDLFEHSYNRLLHDPDGGVKYLRQFGHSGFGLAQFLYLQKKVREGCDIKVRLETPSFSSELKKLDNRDSTHTGAEERYADERTYGSWDGADLIEAQTGNGADQQLVLIRSVTEMGELARILGLRGYKNVREYASEVTGQTFALARTFAEEGRVDANLTIVPVSDNAANAEAVSLLVEEAERDQADRKLFLMALSTLILSFGAGLTLGNMLGADARGRSLFIRTRPAVAAWLAVFALLHDAERMQPAVPRAYRTIDPTAMETGLTAKEAAVKEMFSAYSNEILFEKIVQQYDGIAGMRMSEPNSTWTVEEEAQRRLKKFDDHLRKDRGEERFKALIDGYLRRIDGKGVMRRQFLSRILNKAFPELSQWYDHELSITEQESAFDPTAVSPKGARGLRQLMPYTRVEMLADIKKSGITAETWPEVFRNDDTLNFILGVHYSARLMARNIVTHLLEKSGFRVGEMPFYQLWLRVDGDRIPDTVIEEVLKKNSLSVSEQWTAVALSTAGYNSGPYARSLRMKKIPDNGETPDYVKRIRAYYLYARGQRQAALEAMIEALQDFRNVYTMQGYLEKVRAARHDLREYLDRGGALEPEVLERYEQMQVDYDQLKKEGRESLPPQSREWKRVLGDKKKKVSSSITPGGIDMRMGAGEDEPASAVRIGAYAGMQGMAIAGLSLSDCPDPRGLLDASAYSMSR